jgi:hypothetical protein
MKKRVPSRTDIDRCAVTVTSSISEPAAAVSGTEDGPEEGADAVVGSPLNAVRGVANLICGGETRTCGAPDVPVTPFGLLAVPVDGVGVCAAQILRIDALETMMKPVTVLIALPSSGTQSAQFPRISGLPSFSRIRCNSGRSALRSLRDLFDALPSRLSSGSHFANHLTRDLTSLQLRFLFSGI